MGQVFMPYDFNGLDRLVQRDHVDTGSGGKPGNKTALRYLKQSGASGPTYAGFDRFGRISNLRHVNYNGTTVDWSTAGAPVRFNWGQPATKAVRLEAKRAALLALPQQTFDARRVESAQANSLSLGRFDCNSVSVPTAYADQTVAVIGRIDQLRIVCQAQWLQARRPLRRTKNASHFVAANTEFLSASS